MKGAYCYIDSPIGQLFVATSERGVIRLGFEHEDGVRQQAAADLGQPLVRIENITSDGEHEVAADLLRQAVRELAEYFDGSRKKFDVPIDLHVTGFRGQVVRDLASIPYGQRYTYAEMAERASNPGAVRAVGSACANNPIPIFLPCHRVVRSDGTWGEYRGGEGAKTFLLNLEAGESAVQQ